MAESFTGVAIVDGSLAFRSGSIVTAWDKVTTGNPEAIVLVLSHLDHIGPWLDVVSGWRRAIHCWRAQPALLLHIAGEEIQQVPADLMVKSLEAGFDDFVVATPDSAEVHSRLVQARYFREMTKSLQMRNQELVRISQTDELTGLMNMRAFAPAFIRFCESFSSHADTGILSVVMMDLDRFKAINDTNDHLIGSEMLRLIGKLVGEAVDASSSSKDGFSFAARYGGDEFIMAFHAENCRAAFRVVENLRRRIFTRKFHIDGKFLQVTASFGLVSWSKNTRVNPTAVIERADSMLYRSKKSGRNRISVSRVRNLNSAPDVENHGISMTGQALRDAIDLDHVRRADLIDRYAGGDDNRFARVHQAEIFKKVG